MSVDIKALEVLADEEGVGKWYFDAIKKKHKKKPRKKRLKPQDMMKCIICGKEFAKRSINQMLCGSPDCKRIYDAKRRTEYNKKVKHKKELAKTLVQMALEEKSKKELAGKSNWAKRSPESRAKTLLALERYRFEHGMPAWTEERKEKLRQSRRKSMEKKRIMEAALIKVLGDFDEELGKTNLDAMTTAVVDRVKKTGDPRAAEFIRDTIGEKPKDEKQEQQTMVMFAPPKQLIDKLGSNIVDAEYIEMTERERYEELKKKFEGENKEPLSLEDQSNYDIEDEESNDRPS